MKTALKIHVSGIVQGVGFRPFVYRQAKLHLINGWVLNSADGVHIHAEGEEDLVDQFCLALSSEAPAASQVEEIEMKEVPLEDFETFEIRHSQNKKTSKAGNSSGQTLISPDLATCADCTRELFDKNDRRFRYPFINCTNCGPRFTIIGNLPYDRCYTSMSTFKMCSFCEREYKGQLDRRFHAQPNACFECGPYISWIESENLKRPEGAGFQGAGTSPLGPLLFGETREKSDEIISNCVQFLKDGKIVAIKGLGGFHLACDAANESAVTNLRQRKMRSNKAFAIMAPNLDAVKEICEVNSTEAEILTGTARPIVLLKRKESAKDQIAQSVFMSLPEIGVMLPYTPLQHLLLHDFEGSGGKFLVMTSGNIYDNPIVTEDEKAYEVLADVADAFLGNNRPILARYDDSVVRVIDAAGTQAVQMIRRARGYAPAPIKIKVEKTTEAFATGPEQKNTFAFMRPIAGDNAKANAEVFVSQHIGDVENAEIFQSWEQTKNQFEEIFKFKPSHFYCDMHPEYLTTKWVEEQKLASEKVQHHYAHIRSVMYENCLQGPVCGFAFDGTGYGVDGHIWGGECLLCNSQNFERFANFAYVPMPGGAAAVKDPFKMAFGVLWANDLLDHPALKQMKNFPKAEGAQNLNTMITQGINTPMTSSVGRLFDAASALLGICEAPTYEGEAAILLEAALWDAFAKNPKLATQEFDTKYEIQITKNIATENSTAQDTSVLLFDTANTFKALLDDVESGADTGQIVKNFHDAFVRAIINCAKLVDQLYQIKQVALSGGVFMNRYLIESAIKLLVDEGFSVALNKEVPPNDGGLSLGQL